jgi:hypothetical protein
LYDGQQNEGTPRDKLAAIMAQRTLWSQILYTAAGKGILPTRSPTEAVDNFVKNSPGGGRKPAFMRRRVRSMKI